LNSSTSATSAAAISPPNSQIRCTWRSSTRWYPAAMREKRALSQA
jgi:hypothetical protein